MKLLRKRFQHISRLPHMSHDQIILGQSDEGVQGATLLKVVASPVIDLLFSFT